MSAIKEFDGKSLFLKWQKLHKHTTMYVDEHLAGVDQHTVLATLPQQKPWLLTEKLVVKVDQLVKRRGKLGLVKVNLDWDTAFQYLTSRLGSEMEIEGQKGNLTNFLIERALPHSEESEMYIAMRPYHERYPSFSSGDEILFCCNGGVEMGAADARTDVYSLKVPLTTVPSAEAIESALLKDITDEKARGLLVPFVQTLFDFYIESHHVFLEINPFVVLPEEGRLMVLDWAGKLDSDGRWEARHLWNDLTFPEGFGGHRVQEEDLVRQLDSETGASFKLTILNPKGSIWTLVAGGGASVMYADAICAMGFSEELGNYGEYSGAPSTDLTMRYTRAMLTVILKHKLDTPKVLLIGGAVANFTSVEGTFSGMIQALTEVVDLLLEHNVRIYVRRGGPGYEKGLAMMRKFAQSTGVFVDVNGPDVNMVSIVRKSLTEVFPERCKDAPTPSRVGGSDAFVERVRIACAPKPEFMPIFTPETTCIVYALRPVVIQRMLDFDFASNRPTPSIAAIVDPMTTQKMHKCFFGSKEILLKVFPTVAAALVGTTNVSVLVNLASSRSVYQTVHEAMRSPELKLVAIFAEGVPERKARLLAKEAEERGITMVGPATVGGIHPGAFRIGNSGGTNDNILQCRLYRPGSVAFVTRSGGLSNEMNFLLSRTTNGVYEGIAIGGDRYPGSGFLEHLLRYEADPAVKMLVLVGEVGGTAEYAVCEALKDGRITKPLIALATGITAEKLHRPGMKFGHAGASANSESESASAKNEAMRAAGAFVPRDFEEFESMIAGCYEKLRVAGLVPAPDFDKDAERPVVPLDIGDARARGLVRVPTSFISTITDDRKQELQYNREPISKVVNEPHGIGTAICLLWFKKRVPDYMCEFIEKVIVIVADHGPAVSGAHNTIVTARAGKDLISCLTSGLLTIGDRFGGAINGAALEFFSASVHGVHPDAFVTEKKKAGQYIPGIGHRVKSLRNPDTRVKILVEYAKTHFPMTTTLDYALKVEAVTTQKKENLILNVDGAIGACMVDLLCHCGIFEAEEGKRYIEIGCLNGLFVLGRSIGLLGHAIDQKRLEANLYRHDTSDILYDFSM